MLGTRYYCQEMSDSDAATILHDKHPFMMIANALVPCYSEDCFFALLFKPKVYNYECSYSIEICMNVEIILFL